MALDTEADSYYAYHVKVCLLQLSTRSSHLLIDPLAGLDLRLLRGVFSDPAVLKVWHAGSNDIGLLRHHHGLEFVNTFDTMVAAQVLGLRRPGLASLLKERFGVEQRKAFQTSDWRRRPLSAGQLHYAVNDTAYLLPLKDLLARELRSKRRLEEAKEEFDRLCHAGHSPRTFDPEAFWRVRGARQLDPLELSAVRELYRFREQVAARRDLSPHRVIGDACLLELARRRPRGEGELRGIPGLPARLPDRERQGILRALSHARKAGPLRVRRPSRRGPGEPGLNDLQRGVFEALREWRRGRAGEREVDESRVATTGTLRGIAREMPSTLQALSLVPGMTPFRLREYGEDILGVVRAAHAD